MRKVLENEDTETLQGLVDAKTESDVRTDNKADGKSYRVGTLIYSKKGLAALFLWLLWGDFCFFLMETIVGNVLPLRLKQIGASNVLVGLLVTTIPSIMALVICPMVSFRSDRYRSKWGRRVPFLAVSTPFITIFLLLIAFSSQIGVRLHATLLSGSALSVTAVTLGLISVLIISFQFFNLFVSSVYYYLFNDVVPDEVMGRFMSLFRVVGSSGSVLFNMFVFKYANSHFKEIIAGAALLYFVAFALMFWRVREGDYPPPPENVDKSEGFISSAKTYFLECFTHKFFWFFFLADAVWQSQLAIEPFRVFFTLSLGIKLGQIGAIKAVAGVVGMALLIPAGAICDRKHPVRVMMWSMIGIVIVTPIDMIYLFYNPTPAIAYKILMLSTGIVAPLLALYTVASLPMYMKVLPKEKFGQFASAASMVRCLTLIVCGALAGWFMDALKVHFHGNEYYYRFVPLWLWTFQIMGLLLMLRVFKMWKQRGGDEGYQPPVAN